MSTYPTDPAALDLIDPAIAHRLRVALASYRTPTASRARLLAHLGRIEVEINAALDIAKTSAVPAVLRRVPGAAQ